MQLVQPHRDFNLRRGDHGVHLERTRNIALEAKGVHRGGEAAELREEALLHKSRHQVDRLTRLALRRFDARELGLALFTTLFCKVKTRFS